MSTFHWVEQKSAFAIYHLKAILCGYMCLLSGSVITLSFGCVYCVNIARSYWPIHRCVCVRFLLVNIISLLHLSVIILLLSFLFFSSYTLETDGGKCTREYKNRIKKLLLQTTVVYQSDCSDVWFHRHSGQTNKKK